MECELGGRGRHSAGRCCCCRPPPACSFTRPQLKAAWTTVVQLRLALVEDMLLPENPRMRLDLLFQAREEAGAGRSSCS